MNKEKEKQKCTQKTCPAYKEAKNSGQSAQVLYIEPNFSSTPSEYDVFYDCFSSESDYPTERCRQNSILYPNCARNRNSQKKISNKSDCAGDGTHNFRSSLQQVAYTARILLNSFESTHNQRHHKHTQCKGQCGKVANGNDRVLSAEFQVGNNSADFQEFHMDPYTVRIEPVSLNIPLRIELHATAGTPYSTSLNAAHEDHIEDDGNLVMNHIPNYCMEPIRTATIAAPRPIAITQQFSNMEPFQPFLCESQTSTSHWNASLPPPPPPIESETGNEQYDNCELTCMTDEHEGCTNEKITQVKTICGCCTSQALFMPMPNIAMMQLESTVKPPLTDTEDMQLYKEPSLPIDKKWSKTSNLTLNEFSPPRFLQQTRSSQTSAAMRAPQQTQTSQTFFPTETPENEKEIASETHQFPESHHITQFSQTSLIFDFDEIIEPPLQSMQLSKESTPLELLTIKESPKSSTQSMQVPQASRELDLSTHEENTVASNQSIEKMKSSQELNVSIHEESRNELVVSQQELREPDNLKEESATLPLIILESVHSLEIVSSRHSTVQEGYLAVPAIDPKNLEMQSPPSKLLIDISADEPITESASQQINPISKPRIQSNAETQTIRTIRPSFKNPTQELQSAPTKDRNTPNVSSGMPVSQAILPHPFKKYRLAYPQHKYLETCAPCRYEPSPLVDEHGNVFCPKNCGCCLCAWRARPISQNEQHGKLRVCKCSEKGTVFTKFNINQEICNNTEPFDICPCREKVSAKFLEIYGQEMWTDDEKLSTVPNTREVLLSEVTEVIHTE